MSKRLFSVNWPDIVREASVRGVGVEDEEGDVEAEVDDGEDEAHDDVQAGAEVGPLVDVAQRDRVCRRKGIRSLI